FQEVWNEQPSAAERAAADIEKRMMFTQPQRDHYPELQGGNPVVLIGISDKGAIMGRAGVKLPRLGEADRAMASAFNRAGGRGIGLLAAHAVSFELSFLMNNSLMIGKSGT